MQRKFIDLAGQKFGRLMALRPSFKSKRTYWLCKCECGKEKIIERGNLVCGRTKSCGCLYVGNPTHGFTGTRFFSIFNNMRNRCNNKNVQCFNLYGGRGIKCLWKNFEEFKMDMYESYIEHCAKFGEKNTSIDRINNSGSYSKENCQWATSIEQTNNTRRNRHLYFNGQTKTISQWARIVNISREVIYQRIGKLGWTAEKALTVMPVRGSNQFI